MSSAGPAKPVAFLLPPSSSRSDAPHEGEAVHCGIGLLGSRPSPINAPSRIYGAGMTDVVRVAATLSATSSRRLSLRNAIPALFPRRRHSPSAVMAEAMRSNRVAVGHPRQVSAQQMLRCVEPVPCRDQPICGSLSWVAAYPARGLPSGRAAMTLVGGRAPLTPGDVMAEAMRQQSCSRRPPTASIRTAQVIAAPRACCI